MFGLSKRVRQLETTYRSKDMIVDSLRDRIERLEKKVRELECNHDKVAFVCSCFGLFGKKCKDCGKILCYYKNEGEWKKAKADYHEQESKRIKEELYE